MKESKKSGKLRLFSLNSNRPLAEEISEKLDIPLGKVDIERFSDGEIAINIEESVRGDDVFLIQSTSYPVNDNYMEIFIMADALKRASAETVTVVMPYYGYSRQDRIASPREPISAKVVANMMERSGVDHMITLDMHAPQLQGFFDLPVDHMTAAPVLANYFDKHYLMDNAVVVTPDHASASRGREYAELLDLPMAMMDRRTSETEFIGDTHVIGDVKGKQCVLVDDLSDTGNTITKVSEALMEHGAAEVYVLLTHSLFSGDAAEKIDASPIRKVIATNSVLLREEQRPEKLEKISIAYVLADAVRRVYEYQSVRPLFKTDYIEDLEHN